jgi:hypothetical protein
MLGCEACAAGTPGTEAPGTRGKENTSFSPVKWGSAAHGSVRPPAAGSPAVGAAGTAASSAALGGAVGGDKGMAGTPGKEYISAAGGICGAAAQGPPLPPSSEDTEAGIASGGAAAEPCGASGVAPASEAAIARKSASFNTPLGTDEGNCGTPGTPGTATARGFGGAGTESISGG